MDDIQWEESEDDDNDEEEEGSIDEGGHRGSAGVSAAVVTAMVEVEEHNAEAWPTLLRLHGALDPRRRASYLVSRSIYYQRLLLFPSHRARVLASSCPIALSRDGCAERWWCTRLFVHANGHGSRTTM